MHPPCQPFAPLVILPTLIPVMKTPPWKTSRSLPQMARPRPALLPRGDVRFRSLFPCSSAPSSPRVPLPLELHPLSHHDPLRLPASAHRLSPLSPPCAHLAKPQLRSSPPTTHATPCPSSNPLLEQNTQLCHSSRCPRVSGGLPRTAVVGSASPEHRLSFLSSNCPCPLLWLHSQMMILSGILLRK